MDTATIIEYIGVAIGLIYLFLEYKASLWLWPVGVVMSLLYITIFYQSKFYADAGIYAYYLGANIYGLIEWKRNRKSEHEKVVEMPITHAPKGKILPTLVRNINSILLQGNLFFNTTLMKKQLLLPGIQNSKKIIPNHIHGFSKLTFENICGNAWHLREQRLYSLIPGLSNNRSCIPDCAVHI